MFNFFLNKERRVALLCLPFFYLITVNAEEATTIYVQALKTQLKSEPKFQSTPVVELQRGEILKVLKRQGDWIQVSATPKSTGGGKTVEGWIGRLFVANQAPVGALELSQKLQNDEGLATAARKRPSSYSVSASTRGLMATGNRVREGREKYEFDEEAVRKLDNLELDEKDVIQFQESGRKLK